MIAVAMFNKSGKEMGTCAEAAKAYGCGMSYMRRLAREGRVPTEEHAGSWWFDLEAVRSLAGRNDGGRLKKRATGFKKD
jgi:hypothetical protein